MKIWQVVPYYPPHVGGMEYYVERLSEELAARGHDVTVFTSSNNGTQETYTRNKVKIRTLKIMTKIYNNPISPTLFTQLMTEEKPDIIHAHQYPIFYSDTAATVAWTRKIPLIVHVHVVSDAKSPLSGFISDTYYSTIGLRTLRTAKAVIVPSKAYRTKISQMLVKLDKLKVIPYGIDIKKFKNRINIEEFRIKFGLQDSKVILSTGRLNYQKGFHYLIKAFSNIKKQVSNVKLVIVGEGEQLNYLKQLSKSLKLDNSIIFTSVLDQKEIPKAYAACDVFVLPSLFESFGISLIEAQAAGKPVIGTNVGGVPETFIPNETGMLINPGDVKQIEVETTRLLSDITLANQMGKKGSKFVEVTFSMQNNLSHILRIYNDYVKSR